MKVVLVPFMHCGNCGQHLTTEKLVFGRALPDSVRAWCTNTQCRFDGQVCLVPLQSIDASIAPDKNEDCQ